MLLPHVNRERDVLAADRAQALITSKRTTHLQTFTTSYGTLDEF